jgi:hypothetical protein
MPGCIHLDYKGIRALNHYENGDWYSIFYLKGEPIKRVTWAEGFSFKDVREVIDKEILPFI